MSWPIAHAAFVAHVEPVLAEPIPPVQVLGMDETCRGKPQWGQDPVTGRWTVVHDRWHTAIVDASDYHEVAHVCEPGNVVRCRAQPPGSGKSATRASVRTR